MQAQAYETVLADIESLIVAGELRVGDRLEGERAMAERLGVSRTSVREAIRILTVMGLVRSSPGSGPSAGAQLVAHPDAPLSAALRLHVAAASFAVADVIESRIMLETWAYSHVRKPLQEQLGEATKLCNAMDLADGPTEFLALDASFHLSLVELTGNPLLVTFMMSLREAIAYYTNEASEKLSSWPSIASQLQGEHRQLLNALSTGDGEQAARIAADHIRGYARVTAVPGV